MRNKIMPNEEQFLCACTPDKDEEYCHKNKRPGSSEVEITSTSTVQGVNPGNAKNAKYYYTVDEWDLKKALTKLFKVKRKWKPKKCCCCPPDPDRIPLTECQIRVAVWYKHDLTKCVEIEKEYTFIGEIIFPSCSRTFLPEDPGIPVRQSLKSFCLNNRKTFGDKFLESRKYAYQGIVLSSSCVCK